MIVNPKRLSYLQAGYKQLIDEQGLWSAFRDWMVEQEYYDLFLAAQDFREDHPSFTEVLNAAQTRFHLTDAQIDALLAAAVAD